jgi:glycosyltransferase involved in cell wall biosynthesis
MSKRTVLMVISKYRSSGGHENVINNYCSGLDKLGFDTTIGAFSFEKSPPEHIKSIKLMKYRNLVSGSEDRFDLISSHQTHMNYYSLLTPKPFVFHYHGTSNRLQEMNLRLSAILYKNRISRIISTSNSALNHLRSLVGMTVASEVISNGVDTTYYNTDLEKPYSRGVPQLLFVGNLYSHKNVIRLIEFMPDIIKLYPKAHLQIVGNGSDYQRINELIARKSLDNSIELLGSLYGEELRLRYSSSDIYISASILEASPLPPLEALACGKPLLLSNIPAHKEIVEESEAGHVFSLEDNSSICEMIRETYENRNSLGLKARKFAERCDWQIVCQKIGKIYDQIIEERIRLKS